jgi:hypothetical protein
MVHWKLCSSATQYPHRTFERPLGLTELGFYWDSNFEGTADTLQHAIVEIEHPLLISVENITRTWIMLKHQFPLLGSYLAERREGEEVVFVVEEDRLDTCGPDEIAFQPISSLQEAQKFVDSAVNGQRLLSNVLLARLFILPRTDEKARAHIVIHVAHCVTDGIANATLLRRFLDILSSAPCDQAWKIEERLALAVASEDLVPTSTINATARKRWHRAIGHTLTSIRVAKITVPLLGFLSLSSAA